MSQPIHADLASRYIRHFFSSFLSFHNLAGNSSDGINDASSLLQGSIGLLNALAAIAAMELRRRSLALAGVPEFHAIGFYRAAISSVQTELVDSEVISNDCILWTTFFLGMFEFCPSVCVWEDHQDRAADASHSLIN